MVEINQDTIHYIAKLSKIRMEPSEEKTLLHDMKEILKYIEQLNAVDTDHVSPCNTVLEHMTQTPERDDVAQATMSQKTFLDGAPAKTGAFLRVPPVLKQG
jgi:aspartyl-tRNA(Asn)/glutamyl-tRNA(Gln) amidotransferase subunit C